MGILDLKKSLSENIKRLRKENGLTQVKLAQKLIIGESIAKNLEGINKQNHSWYLIYKIARYFNITIDELIHGNTHLSENEKLFYKIKSLSPLERNMIESYILTRNKISIL